MERSCHEKELELHTRVAKSDEKVAHLTEQLALEKARTAEFEKQKLKAEEKEEEALMRVREAEKELKQALKELSTAQSTSQRAIESHRSYVKAAEKSTVELEEEVEKHKTESQTLLQKHKKREEFVQSVIALNEGLVQKLSEMTNQRRTKDKSKATKAVRSRRSNGIRGKRRIKKPCKLKVVTCFENCK